MAQKYIFIPISFYRNIVCKNVSCELGLTYNKNIYIPVLSEEHIALPVELLKFHIPHLLSSKACSLAAA